MTSRAHISPNGLRVLYRLRDAGFMAFLVGGCVRDLLIGIEPKDFDVATDALPEQVRKPFRNCRLVGRRFRLAHVLFGREIIEVATFRAASAPAPGEEPLPDADVAEGEDRDPEQEGLDTAGSEIASLEDGEASLDSSELDDDEGDDEDDDDDDLGDDAGHPPPSSVPRRSNRYRERPASPNGDESAADLDVDPNAERMFDETGRILRDNVYGTIDADVWRRDLTANALYYNIANCSTWDYVGGFETIAD